MQRRRVHRPGGTARFAGARGLIDPVDFGTGIEFADGGTGRHGNTGAECDPNDQSDGLTRADDLSRRVDPCTVTDTNPGPRADSVTRSDPRTVTGTDAVSDADGRHVSVRCERTGDLGLPARGKWQFRAIVFDRK